MLVSVIRNVLLAYATIPTFQVVPDVEPNDYADAAARCESMGLSLPCVHTIDEFRELVSA